MVFKRSFVLRTFPLTLSLAFSLASCQGLPAANTAPKAPVVPMEIPEIKMGSQDFGVKYYWLTKPCSPAYFATINSCYQSGGHPTVQLENVEQGDYSNCTMLVCAGGSGGGDSDDNSPSSGCGPGRSSCQTDLPPFYFLAHHGNKPVNRSLPPGDNPRSQVTLSPEDVNDAFDWTRLTLRDQGNQGWNLQILNGNNKILKEESGTGSSFVEWDGTNPAGQKVNNGLYTARMTSPADPSVLFERLIRIDNNPPVISNIRVQENASAGVFTVKAKIKEAGNGEFQSGINPDTIQIFFDYYTIEQGFARTYDSATGEFSVQYSSLPQYLEAKRLNQEYGYDFPLEIRVADYAGNEVSSRGTGPDGPLRIQVADPYFSPNADGVKDTLNFSAFSDNSSEPYQIAIKRNGIAVKIWSNLTGNQNLSWNGNLMFTDKVQADGNYRIVASTERQRDRLRDAQMVVLDTVGPIFSNSRLQKKNGGYRIQSAMSDKPAGILPGSLSLAFQNVQGQEIEISGQWETENGISPFVYNLQASAEQFNQLKEGDIQVKASVQDNAGNTVQASLNFEDDISLNSFTQEPDGSLLLKGKILKNTGSFATLTPDFGGNLEILSSPVISRTANAFEIRISDYKFAESLVEEPQLGDVIAEKVSLWGQVKGCDANGECLNSNQKELKTPECTSLQAPDENTDLFSNCKASESFSIQAAPNAPGAAILTRHYIHGGGQNNKPLGLGFSMRNTSKQSQIVGYWITDASGKWVKTLKRTVYPPTGNDYGPTIRANWDGTNAAGQVVGQGTYYTVIRAPGKTDRATKIIVGCQGYYAHYPKVMSLSRRSHIMFRHNAQIYDNGWLQILENWVDRVYTTMTTVYLRNQVMDRYRWSSGDKGKGSLFPDNWTPTQIENNVSSVGNFELMNDTCETQNDGRFRLHGTRDNVPLRVVVDRNSVDFVTGFPPNGIKPEIYYTQSHILLDLIGRN